MPARGMCGPRARGGTRQRSAPVAAAEREEREEGQGGGRGGRELPGGRGWRQTAARCERREWAPERAKAAGGGGVHKERGL